jgi:hypothetical protein
MPLNISKKKTTTLFTHLILFDFFFIDSRSKQDLVHFGSFQSHGLQKKVYLLSLFAQFKSFKQFFRQLQFLKDSKQRKILNIITPLDNHVSLFQDILKLRLQTQIISSFSKQQKTHHPLKMLLLLDYPVMRSQHIFNCVTRTNLNLVQTINSAFEVNFLGYYKIHNNILNLNRLIFIGVLIKQILK